MPLYDAFELQNLTIWEEPIRNYGLFVPYHSVMLIVVGVLTAEID